MRHAKLASYSDHDLATTIWAVANMTCPKPAGRIFVEELVDAACKQPTFAPQGLSMTLWACATLAATTLDLPKDKVLAALLPQVIAAADSFHPQGASNILWALATMDAHADRTRSADAAQNSETRCVCFMGVRLKLPCSCLIVVLQLFTFETCNPRRCWVTRSCAQNQG